MDEARVDAFKRDGFLAIPRLADARTVARLGDVYDAMLRREIDVSATDNPLGMITRQIMMPSNYHPIFRDNPAKRKAREIAKALLEGAGATKHHVRFAKKGGEILDKA